MGEPICVSGKFNVEKERHAEIQKVLITGLSKHLDPLDSWDEVFWGEDEVLKLIRNQSKLV